LCGKLRRGQSKITLEIEIEKSVEESKKTKKNCVREERRRVCEGEENI